MRPVRRAFRTPLAGAHPWTPPVSAALYSCPFFNRAGRASRVTSAVPLTFGGGDTCGADVPPSPRILSPSLSFLYYCDPIEMIYLYLYCHCMIPTPSPSMHEHPFFFNHKTRSVFFIHVPVRNGLASRWQDVFVGMCLLIGVPLLVWTKRCSLHVAMLARL